MKRIYRLPVIGKVIKKDPLQGASDDPVRVLPLEKIAPKIEVDDLIKGKILVNKYSFSYVCLNYNIDEEWCEVEVDAEQVVHNWLGNILPQLNDIKEAKGWKLDKSRLEEAEK